MARCGTHAAMPAPMSESQWHDAIMSRIQKSDSCWEYLGAHSKAGYAQAASRLHGRFYVHRFVYERLVGPIPEGLTLDHLCRNRGCVNPQHLEPVSNGENLRRGSAARWTGRCKRGHDLTRPDAWHWITRQSGRRKGYRQRQCRLCFEEHQTKGSESNR